MQKINFICLESLITALLLHCTIDSRGSIGFLQVVSHSRNSQNWKSDKCLEKPERGLRRGWCFSDNSTRKRLKIWSSSEIPFMVKLEFLLFFEVGDHIHFLLNFRQIFHQFWWKFWWFEFSIEFSPKLSPISVKILVIWRNWWVFKCRKFHHFWWQ